MSWITSVHDVSFQFFPNSGRYSVSKFSASISKFCRHITCPFFSRCLLLQWLIPPPWSGKLLWRSPPFRFFVFAWLTFFSYTYLFNRLWMRSSQWMRSSRVVRASVWQPCQSPGFAPSVHRYNGIWVAADEAVLNKVLKKSKKSPIEKNNIFFMRRSFCLWLLLKSALASSKWAVKYM